MSDPRRAAELAVIEAARRYGADMTRGNWDRVWDAIEWLDNGIPPPPPPGETERVRVAVYRLPSGHLHVEVITDEVPHGYSDASCVAIITADIPTEPPAHPEVAATVEEAP